MILPVTGPVRSRSRSTLRAPSVSEEAQIHSAANFLGEKSRQS